MKNNKNNKTPLAKYKDLALNLKPEWDANDIAYAAILDRRYKIEVQRKKKEDGTSYGQLGILIVFDGADNDKIIFEEDTTISYSALFGADIGDINSWQNKACDVVDNIKK